MRSKNFLLFGFALLFVSLAFFYIETAKYEKSDELPYDYKMYYEDYTLEVNNDTDLYISKYKHQNINLIKDEKLVNQVKVVVAHPNSSVVSFKTVREEIDRKDLLRLYIQNDMNVNHDELRDIVNLGIRTIKNKVKYNYSLLKYGNVYVYANEDFFDNIILVNYGYVDED